MRNWFRRRLAPREEFARHRRELLRSWFAALAASGSPRGLVWVGYTDSGEVIWAKSATELAMVPVMIQFEPVAGGGMEDVPQAREPRPVVALFRWDRKRWVADGRAYFNLTPRQMIERSAGSWVELS